LWKEKRKSRLIKKDLEENKENIINPNTEDTKTDEEFQKVIETAVAEKAEEEKDENTEKNEDKRENKKEQKETKSNTTSEDKSESSIFDETTSLDTPSEKNLNDKEKNMIDRIIIEATTLKNG
jgi:hypothetical protein